MEFGRSVSLDRFAWRRVRHAVHGSRHEFAVFENLYRLTAAFNDPISHRALIINMLDYSRALTFSSRRTFRQRISCS